MRTTIITKLALVALVTVFVGGCQKQSRTGEAFVVLKSGEVLFMADMEVVCLKSSFKEDFSGLRAEYGRQAPVRGVAAENPAANAELKKMDDSIVELNAKIGSASADEKEISDRLTRALESKRDKLVAEISKNKDVLEEYRPIAEPLDRRVKESKVEVEKIKQDKKTLTDETIQKINSYIVDSKLTISKLELDSDDSNEDGFFETIHEYTQHYPSIGSPESRRVPNISALYRVHSPFLAEKKIKSIGYGPDPNWTSDWTFLKNVPSALEGTPMEAVIKSAYQRSQALKLSLRKADDNLRAEEERRYEQLLPWQNRHGISLSKARELVEQEDQQKSNLAQLDERISEFKAGSPEVRAKVRYEIKKRVTELNESLASLKKRREDLVEWAANKAKEAVEGAFERAKNELNVEYRRKFYELLKKNSLYAVRTGSKGDFIVSGETAYLYAETQRDNGEKIGWLVTVDPKAQKIKMSLSNAASAGSGDFDDFWMLHLTLAN